MMRHTMQNAPIPADEQDRLAALRELEILDTPAEERFDRVTRLCQRLFGVPMAFVNLVSDDGVHMKSVQGVAPVVMPREAAFCSFAVLDEAGLVIEDTVADVRFADNPLVTDDPNVRFYAGMPLAAPGGQRVGTLCIADTAPRELTEGDRALLQDLALWVQKELNIEEELDRAAEVQRALFPARPLDAPGWEVAGACRPSREVGGDFFDWYRTAAGPVISLGDVMGKGMPAAIVMASVRAALRAGGRRPDLAEGLQDAAWSLTDDLEATATFSTAVLARLGDDGTVTLADAGHGHTAVVRADGSVEVHPDGGLPLGIDIGESYVAETISLEAGDLLVLHSDGILEIPGGPADSRAAGELLEGATSAEEALDRILALTEGQSLPDDVTAVVARRVA